MTAIARIVRAADRLPRYAVEDAIGLAFLCLLIGGGFSAAGLY
ncbi:hypothetical protein ACQ5SO_01255 [Rhodovulum sp. DZ06]